MSGIVVPLHKGFAAKIVGLDIAHLDSPDIPILLHRAFKQFGVLLLPDQKNATRENLQRFAALFGDTSICDDITNLDANDNILDAQGLDARYSRGNALWHMDMPMVESPPIIAMLLGREIPAEGGETQFGNLARAYAKLGWLTRRRYRQLTAGHSLETARRKFGITDPSELKSEYGSEVHPLVCVDPHSLKPTLLVSAHTSHICEMPAREGNALIDDLIARATRPENVYTHRWRPHDLLLWSNRRAIHHVQPYDYRRERRRLWRVEVRMNNERPQPVPRNRWLPFL